jgi:1,2-dihydroxy-3-keto-5-methylthiopentene dioxygenase
MTLLQVMAEGDRDDVLLRTTDLAVIAAELAPFNITLEQWDTVELSDDAGQDEVLEAYTADV